MPMMIHSTQKELGFVRRNLFYKESVTIGEKGFKVHYRRRMLGGDKVLRCAYGTSMI